MRVGDNGGLQGRGISLFFDGLAPLDIVQHSGVSCCLGTERTGTLFRPLLYLFGNGCSYQIHGGVVCLRFCAKLCLAIQSAVPEVYEQIRRYHSQVQQIDHQHIGVMDIDTQDKLGADAGDIATISRRMNGRLMPFALRHL